MSEPPQPSPSFGLDANTPAAFWFAAGMVWFGAAAAYATHNLWVALAGVGVALGACLIRVCDAQLYRVLILGLGGVASLDVFLSVVAPPVWLGLVVTGLAVVLYPRRITIVAVAVAWAATGLVGFVLWRAQLHPLDFASPASRLFWALCFGAIIARLRGDGIAHSPAVVPPTSPRPGRTEFLTVSMVLGAATLPLGEGIAFVGAGLVVVAMVVHGQRPPLPSSWFGATLVGLGAAVLGALLAHLQSDVFWLSPRELGRHAPWLLLAVYYSAVRLRPNALGWAALAFSVTAVTGALVGISVFAYTSLSDTAGALVENFSNHQSRVPGDVTRLVSGGFFFHRLKMGHVSLMVLGCLGGVAIALPRWRRWAVAGAAITAAALVLTYVRGATLAAIAAAILTIVSMGLVRRMRPVQWAWLVIAVLLAGVASASFAPGAFKRLQTSLTPNAASDRALIWEVAADTLQSSPQGVGLGNYSALATQRYAERAPNRELPPTYAHHLLLSWWVEGGVVAACGMLVMWLTLLWRARTLLALAHGPRRAAAIACVFVMWAVGLASLTHDVFYHKPVALTFAAFVGAVIGFLDARQSNAPKPDTAGA